MSMEKLIRRARERNEGLNADVLRKSLQTAVRFAERGDEHAPFKGLLFIVGEPSRIKKKGECTRKQLQDLVGTVQDVCNDVDDVARGLKMACNVDGAVVIDGSTGQFVCGAFSVDDLSGVADGLSGQRGRAASSIAQLTQSFAIKVSEECCGSANAPPKDGILHVFAGLNARETLKFKDVEQPQPVAGTQVAGGTSASVGTLVLVVSKPSSAHGSLLTAPKRAALEEDLVSSKTDGRCLATEAVWSSFVDAFPNHSGCRVIHFATVLEFLRGQLQGSGPLAASGGEGDAVLLNDLEDGCTVSVRNLANFLNVVDEDDRAVRSRCVVMTGCEDTCHGSALKELAEGVGYVLTLSQTLDPKLSDTLLKTFYSCVVRVGCPERAYTHCLMVAYNTSEAHRRLHVRRGAKMPSPDVRGFECKLEAVGGSVLQTVLRCIGFDQETAEDCITTWLKPGSEWRSDRSADEMMWLKFILNSDPIRLDDRLQCLGLADYRRWTLQRLCQRAKERAQGRASVSSQSSNAGTVEVYTEDAVSEALLVYLEDRRFPVRAAELDVSATTTTFKLRLDSASHPRPEEAVQLQRQLGENLRHLFGDDMQITQIRNGSVLVICDSSPATYERLQEDLPASILDMRVCEPPEQIGLRFAVHGSGSALARLSVVAEDLGLQLSCVQQRSVLEPMLPVPDAFAAPALLKSEQDQSRSSAQAAGAAAAPSSAPVLPAAVDLLAAGSLGQVRDFEAMGVGTKLTFYYSRELLVNDSYKVEVLVMYVKRESPAAPEDISKTSRFTLRNSDEAPHEYSCSFEAGVQLEELTDEWSSGGKEEELVEIACVPICSAEQLEEMEKDPATETRRVLLTGEMNAGKSSFARACVMPMLLNWRIPGDGGAPRLCEDVPGQANKRFWVQFSRKLEDAGLLSLFTVSRGHTGETRKPREMAIGLYKVEGEPSKFLLVYIVDMPGLYDKHTLYKTLVGSVSNEQQSSATPLTAGIPHKDAQRTLNVRAVCDGAIEWHPPKDADMERHTISIEDCMQESAELAYLAATKSFLEERNVRKPSNAILHGILYIVNEAAITSHAQEAWVSFEQVISQFSSMLRTAPMGVVLCLNKISSDAHGGDPRAWGCAVNLDLENGNILVDSVKYVEGNLFCGFNNSAMFLHGLSEALKRIKKQGCSLDCTIRTALVMLAPTSTAGAFSSMLALAGLRRVMTTSQRILPVQDHASARRRQLSAAGHDLQGTASSLDLKQQRVTLSFSFKEHHKKILGMLRIQLGLLVGECYLREYETFARKMLNFDREVFEKTIYAALAHYASQREYDAQGIIQDFNASMADGGIFDTWSKLYDEKTAVGGMQSDPKALLFIVKTKEGITYCVPVAAPDDVRRFQCNPLPAIVMAQSQTASNSSCANLSAEYGWYFASDSIKPASALDAADIAGRIDLSATTKVRTLKEDLGAGHGVRKIALLLRTELQTSDPFREFRTPHEAKNTLHMKARSQNQCGGIELRKLVGAFDTYLANPSGASSDCLDAMCNSEGLHTMRRYLFLLKANDPSAPAARDAYEKLRSANTNTSMPEWDAPGTARLGYEALLDAELLTIISIDGTVVLRAARSWERECLQKVMRAAENRISTGLLTAHKALLAAYEAAFLAGCVKADADEYASGYSATIQKQHEILAAHMAQTNSSLHTSRDKPPSKQTMENMASLSQEFLQKSIMADVGTLLTRVTEVNRKRFGNEVLKLDKSEMKDNLARLTESGLWSMTNTLESVSNTGGSASTHEDGSHVGSTDFNIGRVEEAAVVLPSILTSSTGLHTLASKARKVGVALDEYPAVLQFEKWSARADGSARGGESLAPPGAWADSKAKIDQLRGLATGRNGGGFGTAAFIAKVACEVKNPESEWYDFSCRFAAGKKLAAMALQKFNFDDSKLQEEIDADLARGG